MLTEEDNEAITRVGPGTLMGNFMREYWVPAALSSELPQPDSDPLRVMLLGEQLIAFRDTSGTVGLIQNLCPHRGSSLFLGRNEENGIRCVYHGWKFDVTGTCVDMPNEPARSNFKDKVRAKAYPCVERGGLIWTYMGSREVLPPLPDIEATLLPEGEFRASATMRPCNWLQALEGDIDTVHAAFLHGGHNEADWYPEGSMTWYELQQRAPSFACEDTDYGTIYGAYRPGPPGQNYWRIGQYMFPFWTSPGTSVLGTKVMNRAWVPMDDSHTMVFGSDALSGGSGVPASARAEMKPNSSDWFGRFNTVSGPENDYMIDREDQRELGTYSGMRSENDEDAAVQVYMSPTLDRTIEHLGTSDLMIIRTRQRLLAAARAFAEHKITPPGVDTPAAYGQRAGGVYIPEEADWLQFIKPLTEAFVDHPELSVSIYGRDHTGGGRIRGRRHKRSS
jgi:phenylpropionate dioxygenase-like ring-hydroxylating dioxygenase large terminal subunit